MPSNLLFKHPHPHIYIDRSKKYIEKKEIRSRNVFEEKSIRESIINLQALELINSSCFI